MSEIMEAVAAIAGGRVVVVPTDTVYGIAAALDADGVDALFRLKRRPRYKAIPVLAATGEDAARVAVFDRPARSLAQRFWPGPLTLVLPRAEGFEIDLGGTDPLTVAVRVPEHPLARELLDATGPLPVTSANESGEPPAETVASARTTLGPGVSVYLDGGTCDGAPSTVAALRGGFPRTIRQGVITEGELQQALTTSSR